MINSTSSQESAPVIFLRNIHIEFVKPIRLSLGDWKKKYINRVFQSQLSEEIGQDLKVYLATQGYYFTHIDSSWVRIDYAMAQATLFFRVHEGNPLKLCNIEIKNDSTLYQKQIQQVKEIVRKYLGKTYTQALTRSLFEELLNYFEDRGYPLARVKTEGFQISQDSSKDWLLSLHLNIIPGDSISLSYIRFSERNKSESTYLLRLLRFQPGEAYKQRRVDRYLRILRRQDYIKTVEIPRLMRDGKNRYFLQFNLQEAPSTSFDGIVGYIPPQANSKEEKGYLTGLVNIGIRNLFGPGRKLKIFWQKQDRFSDEFRLAYREPFVFGLPFHLGVGMNRLVRDTTYIEWQYNANLEFPISDALSAFIKIYNRGVAPDSLASRQLRLPRTQSFSTETGLHWDRRDNVQNPQHGLYFQLSWRFGSQKNIGPGYLIKEDSLPNSLIVQRVTADMAFFFPTFRWQLIANHLHAAVVSGKGGQLRLPDLIWFGGATSVRGYREAQFYGDRVLWTNTEYRFVLSSNTRFFLFLDNAFFSRKFPQYHQQWLTAYGLGIRLPGPLGIVQVDFGLAKGTPFREGKIHFRLINEF